jgi:hypothetical protein
MSAKRLNKRQLREQQELEELARLQKAEGAEAAVNDDQAGHGEGVEESAEEEQPATAARGGPSIFAQLAEETSLSAGEDSAEDIATTAVSSKSKKNKKKKKKKAGAKAPEAATPNAEVEADATAIKEDTEAAAATVSAPKSGSKKKPRKSNNRAVSKDKEPAKDMSNMSMDEFSALLASQAQIDAEQAGENGQSDYATVTPLGPLSSLRALLALSPPALDPAVELKRQFGAAAIKAYEAEAGGGGAQSASSGARARAQAWNTNFKVRNILVQPKETWPPIARTFTGMTMEVLDAPGRGKMGGWVHSRAYRKAQFQFLQAVQSYEPNHLMALLQMYPWHIDSLLQLSDVSRHQGDLGQASDFNARALFAFERTAAPIFTSSLTSHLGPPMLNFHRVEDRGFWLAAHRNVNFLGRRGTWRTSLEWVKLILGLDPPRDPHGMLLWLDFLSIKSRQHTWFLDTIEKLDAALTQDQERSSEVIAHGQTPFDDDLPRFANVKDGKGSLNWCLGLMYARALALRAIEKEERREGKESHDEELAKSTAALRYAMALHPHVLPALLDKIGVPLPAGIAADHPIFRSSDHGDTMPEILAQIYVARSESLWRDGDTGSWLAKTLKDAWPVLDKAYNENRIHRASCAAYSYQEGIWRHILVSDLPDALRQKLIGLIPQNITQDSANLDAFDPLPPFGEGTTTYDDEYFSTMQSRRGGIEDMDYPSEAAAGLMDRLMQAFQTMRGGGQEAAAGDWQAAMQNMDDETRQDVMAQMMDIAAQAQNARMPGALDGNDDDVDEGDQGTAQNAGRFTALRGFLDRVWGGNEVTNANDSATEDEEEEGEQSDASSGQVET